MARAVENNSGQIFDSLAIGPGDSLQVLGDRRFDVDLALRRRPDSDLVHVDEWPWVEHRAARRNGHGREGVVGTVGQGTRAVNRINSNVHLRPSPRADALTVEQHRGMILLALADDNDRIHLNGIQHQSHRFNRGTVSSDLIAATHLTTGRQCGRLGHAHQFQRQVACRFEFHAIPPVLSAYPAPLERGF